MKRPSFVIAAALLALPSAARAEIPAVLAAPAAVPAPDETSLPPRGSRPGEVTLAAGIRGMILPSAGLDPYASGNDVMMMLSLSGGVTLLRAGSVSLVASAEWNMGSRSDSARGQDASLTLHRLGGALETRWQPARRLYLSAKLAPAAFAILGSVMAPGLDRPQVARPWTWGLDATGSAGLLLGTAGHGRFWMVGEVGYTFAGTAAMRYAPTGSDTDPRHYGTLMMPAFTPAGGVSRLAMAVSF